MSTMSALSAELDTVRAIHPYGLSSRADCYSPDAPDSAGSHFLGRVRDAVIEAIEYDENVITDYSDACHEIADSAVPVYTGEVWRVFADLGAWQEDASELGADASDMTRAAMTSLYIVAERLAAALFGEIAESVDV